MKKYAALILIACLLASASLADTISFSGTVEASTTKEIYAPVGGTVEEVPVKAGQEVTAETVIARIKTTKVYASEDGTITSVFGQVGDDAENVTSQYGGVMYLEGNAVYTISASTSKAYEDKENYLVHSGETVYIASRNHTLNQGTGLVTSVDSSSFTVQISSGAYYVGDSFDIFRSADYTNASRIGRGTIARVAPVAITGSGSIVSFAVSAGDQVKRGQLLFETVDGTFDGLEMTGTEIPAGVDGTIATLNVTQGSTVSKNSVVAVIYPKDAVWVTASVAETDLKDLQVGQNVLVELDWNQDQGATYTGRVEMISFLGTTGGESTTFPVYVSFLPDQNTRYGMTALVSTLEDEHTAPTEEKEEAADTEKDASEARKEEAPEMEQTEKNRPSREGKERTDEPSGERPERTGESEADRPPEND
ncbi:MAG: HlyD family efflux transporter periplasmic adaptor subunit [Clostridia bacterium]|nr:HlyD family efflux transporter periplasmic adaptor subunit [Clostridia bacterium]